MAPEDALIRSEGFIIGTDIPTDSGLSGGPLIDLEATSVIGIASRDPCVLGMDASIGAGESKFTPILPLLALGLPEGVQFPNQPPPQPPMPFHTILDLVQWGEISDIGDCVHSTRVVGPAENSRVAVLQHEGIMPYGCKSDLLSARMRSSARCN
jgi:hypothetical protein